MEFSFAHRFSDSDLTQYVKDSCVISPACFTWLYRINVHIIDLTHCFNAWFQWWTILPTLLSTKRIPRWALSSQRWWPSSVGPSDGCVAVRLWAASKGSLDNEQVFSFCASGGAFSFWWRTWASVCFFLCVWRCVEHVMKKHQMARSGCMQKVAFECELVDGDIYSLFSIHRCFDDSFLYLCLVLNYRMLVC